jgi:hypothetical protein
MPVSIVAPVIASMDASGFATVESIEATHVAMTGIEYVYGTNIQRNGALLGAFTVADADPAAGQANLTVSLDATFKAALISAMEAAMGGLASGASLATGAFPTAAASALLEATLNAEITNEMATDLDDNGVLEFLEANALSTLDIQVNWSGAADSMFAALDANALKMLYLQIGNRPINDNDDLSDNASATFSQVMNVGDKLAFVFDLATTITITQVDKNAVTAIDNGDISGDSTGVAPALGAAVTQFSTPSRRVAFVLTVV